MCDNILIMYRLNIWSPLEVILPFYKLVVLFGWWWNLIIKQHVKFVNQAVKKHVSKDFQRCHRTMPSCCNPPPWDPGTCRHCQKSNAVLRRRATVTEGGWIHPSLKIPGSYRKGQVSKIFQFSNGWPTVSCCGFLRGFKEWRSDALVFLLHQFSVALGENPSGRQPCDLLQHCGMMCWLKYLRLSKFSATTSDKTSNPHDFFGTDIIFP